MPVNSESETACDSSPASAPPAEPAIAAIAPAGQPSRGKWPIAALALAAFAGGVGLLWWLSSVFIPLGLGLVLAYLLAPAVDWLQPKIGSRALAAAVMIGSFVCAVVLAGLGATPALVRETRHWAAAVSGESLPGSSKLPARPIHYGAFADPDGDTWTARELAATAQQAGAPPEVVDTLRRASPAESAGDVELREAMGDRDGDGWLDPGYGQRWRQLSRDRKTWVGAAVAKLTRSGLPTTIGRWASGSFSKGQLDKLLGGQTLSTAGDVGLRVLGSVRQALSTALAVIVAAVLIPVYAFLFSLSLPRWKARLPHYLPHANRDELLRVGRRIARSFAGFLRGRLIVCSIVGLVTALGWWALDVRLGLLLGLLAGVLTLVPLASLIAFAPVVLMGLLDVGADMQGWGWFAGVCGVFALGQLLDSLLNPLIVGDAVDLDMMTMIVALLAGGVAFGFVGLVIAVPIAASARILAQEMLLPRWRVWAAGGPLPSPDVAENPPAEPPESPTIRP